MLRYPILLLLGLLLTSPASGQAGYEGSRWLPKVEAIEALLHEGEWKKAGKRAAKLARRVAEQSWYEPDLREVLMRLEVVRAIGAASLGDDEEAVWHWLAAQNFDRRVFQTELDGFPEAEKLLREHRLRQPGESPPGMTVRRSPFPSSYQRPAKLDGSVLELESVVAGGRERPRPVEAEVIVDEEGRMRHPVLTSGGSHPVMIYAFFEQLLRQRRLSPARIDGEPVAVFFDVELELEDSRW